MDSIKEALGGLVDLYTQVEQVKLAKQYQKAQLSFQSLNEAAVRQNAQAAAQTAAYDATRPSSMPLLLTAGLIAGAVFLMAGRTK